MLRGPVLFPVLFPRLLFCSFEIISETLLNVLSHASSLSNRMLVTSGEAKFLIVAIRVLRTASLRYANQLTSYLGSCYSGACWEKHAQHRDTAQYLLNPLDFHTANVGRVLFT